MEHPPVANMVKDVHPSPFSAASNSQVYNLLQVTIIRPVPVDVCLDMRH